METLKDSRACELYVINGYVCTYFDTGKRPTKYDVMKSWLCMHGRSERRHFTFMDIETIIEKVSKFYN